MSNLPSKLLLVDREGDQLEVQALADTLFIGAQWNPDEVWALDTDEVRKLRDACNAFLAANGEQGP